MHGRGPTDKERRVQAERGVGEKVVAGDEIAQRLALRHDARSERILPSRRQSEGVRLVLRDHTLELSAAPLLQRPELRDIESRLLEKPGEHLFRLSAPLLQRRTLLTVRSKGKRVLRPLSLHATNCLLKRRLRNRLHVVLLVSSRVVTLEELTCSTIDAYPDPRAHRLDAAVDCTSSPPSFAQAGRD